MRRSGGVRRARQPLDQRRAGEAPLVADAPAGQPALLREREDGVLVHLEERGGLPRREHLGDLGGAERMVADDERGLAGLDDDAARQRAGRLGAEAAQGVQAVVGVRVDVAGDEAGDEGLLRRAGRGGGTVELSRLGGRQADEEGGGVGVRAGAARRHIGHDIRISPTVLWRLWHRRTARSRPRGRNGARSPTAVPERQRRKRGGCRPRLRQRTPADAKRDKGDERRGDHDDGDIGQRRASAHHGEHGQKEGNEQRPLEDGGLVPGRRRGRTDALRPNEPNAYASSGFSGSPTPRASTPPPASPGRGSGRGASRPGRSAGAGVPGTFGGGEAVSASAKTSSSVLPARSATNSSFSIVSRLRSTSEIVSRRWRCSVSRSFARWWAASTIRRISSSISRAISSE